jgi:hypothetical protein
MAPMGATASAPVCRCTNRTGTKALFNGGKALLGTVNTLEAVPDRGNVLSALSLQFSSLESQPFYMPLLRLM